MFIKAENGRRLINSSYILDLIVTGGSEPGESAEHPWKVVANVRYPDKARQVVLFEDARIAVCEDVMKTYTRLFEGGRP